jgi:putative ABC transport system permease protein
MFDRDQWKEIYATLANNKLRTSLTAFGVSWGIIMLIVMLGAGSGLKNGVTSEFDGFAMNSLYVWTQNVSIPYKGLPAGRWFNLRNGDTEAIIANIPEIEVIAPRNEVGGFRGTSSVRILIKADG